MADFKAFFLERDPASHNEVCRGINPQDARG